MTLAMLSLTVIKARPLIKLGTLGLSEISAVQSRTTDHTLHCTKVQKFMDEKSLC